MDRLHKYKNQPLYDVPEHYFEQFQFDVMQRVKMEKSELKNSKKWISLVGVAASIVIIIGLSIFLFLNRDANEHFYVHEDVIQSDNSIQTLDSNCLAEAMELAENSSVASIETTDNFIANAPLAAQKETIVYRAVDYYLDDYTTDNFCEVMYDLECFYDY